jgi:hypothetical protein
MVKVAVTAALRLGRASRAAERMVMRDFMGGY